MNSAAVHSSLIFYHTEDAQTQVDNARLKRIAGGNYFEELLARIRDILSYENVFDIHPNKRGVNLSLIIESKSFIS